MALLKSTISKNIVFKLYICRYPFCHTKINLLLMKQLLFAILLFFSVSGISQTLQWNSNYLTIGDVSKNAFTIFNSSDNSIKLKMRYSANYRSEVIIEPKSSKTFNFYPYINEFSGESVSQISSSAYYDLDCYQRDMVLINRLAEERIRKANAVNNFKALLRIIGTTAQASDDPKWKNTGSGINAGVDFFETFESIQKNGLTQTIIDKIEDKLKGDPVDMAIDATLKNIYLNTIAKNLKILYDYSKNNVSVDLSDLQTYAYILSFFVSNNSLSNYNIDYYRTIRDVVDPDHDDITNIYDDCPNSFGYAKYKGCTKEYLKQKKKSIRQSKKRKDFYSFYFDVMYSYSPLGLLEKDTSSYSRHLINKAFYTNISIPVLQHNIGKSKGCIMLDVNGRLGNTINKDVTINDNNTGEKKLNLFDDWTAYAGLSYAFMFNRHSKTSFIINPKAGRIIYSKIETKGLNYGNEPVKKDAFILSKNSSMYADLMFRIVFRDNNHYGINFGAKYYKNPAINKNTAYNYSWLHNGKDFSYPKNSLMFYGGLSLVF